jgi:hypothetical protein
MIEGGSGSDEHDLEALMAKVDQELGNLIGAVQTTDPQMARSADSTKKRVRDDLAKLLSKLRNSQKNREGTGTR